MGTELFDSLGEQANLLASTGRCQLLLKQASEIFLSIWNWDKIDIKKDLKGNK